MSRKHKGPRAADQEKMLERARRELARGNSREALKEAKLCFRTVATNEHRQLLEQAYVARISDLNRAGLGEQARASLDELLKLGVTVPEVREKIPRLQVLLGSLNAAAAQPAAILEANPELLTLVADQAVLHPERAQAASEVLRQDAATVRAALEAIERGEEAAATERLNGIARQSLLADWKLFARGLSAHYARDRERRQANWDRLDPNRAAWRIAQTVLVFSGDVPAEQVSAKRGDGVRRLQYAFQDGGISDQLRLLAGHARDAREQELLQTYRALRQRFGQSHPELVERVTDLLWKRAIRLGLDRELEQLTRLAPAPAIDPHWNRARALCFEHSRATASATEEVWQSYLKDLAKASGVSADERAMGTALVHLRLARIFVRQAQRSSFDFGSWLRRASAHPDSLRELATYHFQESRKRYPGLLAAHKELAEHFTSLNRPEDAAAVYESALKHFPDDYDILLWLVVHYQEADEPESAEPFLGAAQRLRPRDVRTLGLTWNQCVATARHATRKRRFPAAREALAAAAAVALPGREPYWLDAMHAAVAYKAKELAAAQQSLQAALAHMEDPAPVWLMMSACAVRWGLGNPLKKEFDAKLSQALRGPARSDTAGRMAKFLLTCVARKCEATQYTGLTTHVRLFKKYLDRCRHVKWAAADLRQVCSFAGACCSTAKNWREQRFLREFAEIGVRAFPDDPSFFVWSAEAELMNGPIVGDLASVREDTQHALELQKTAAVPMDEDLALRAKRTLALTDELLCGAGADEFSDEDEYEDDDEDEDEYDEFADDEYDEEEYDEEEVAPGLPADLTEDELRRMLPPGMLEFLKRQCANLGVSLNDMLGSVLNKSAAQPPKDEWTDAPEWLDPPKARGPANPKASRRR